MLEKEPSVRTIFTNEFVLKPHLPDPANGEKALPFFIDGEDFDASELHVKLIPSAIPIYTAE